MLVRIKTIGLVVALVFGIAPIAAFGAIEKGPYVQNPDTSSITICWVSDWTGVSVVEYGKTHRLDQRVTAELSPRHQIWYSGEETGSVAFHQVRIEGLETDTRYYYRVRDGHDVSEINTFHTAVRPGTPFEFVAWGDSRPMGSKRTVMGTIDALPVEPRFLLNNGDLVSFGQRWPEWHEFFQINGARLARTPLYPALGNHEDNADAYFHLFALPGNERYYSFDYGDVRVITLDSNYGFREDPEQTRWLIRELRSAYETPYIFIQLHHPLYSCTNQFHRRVANADLRREWAPIFEAAEVTAVFSGHDHSYQHNLVNGVHYLVTGGGGATLHDVRPREFTIAAARAYHIIRVAIEENEAQFTVIDTETGEVIEQFALPRRDISPYQGTYRRD